MVDERNVHHLEKAVQESPQTIDHYLSKELLRLSLKDRNAIDEEIHGVSTLAPRETPELLEASLKALSEELDAIPDETPAKEAYLLSQKLKETYVNTPDFRLRFLRCELFDAKLAALRLLKFLGFASSLFGNTALERPVRIKDLTKSEEQHLRVGNAQVLPFRDRKGRPIYAWVGDFALKQGTVQSRHRMAWYVQNALSEDVETQQRGLVKLIFVGDSQNGQALAGVTISEWTQNFEYQKRFTEALPLRTCAVHYCFPNAPFFHALRRGHALTQGGATRSRLRFHVGEPTELLYHLKTYGIPVEVIPVTGNGNIKATSWRQWLRARKLLEGRAKPSSKPQKNVTPEAAPSIILLPGSHDVLFRKGVSLTYHPGNSIFQGLMELRIQEHSAASITEKISITESIIAAVRAKEGRFLEWNAKGWWTELPTATQVHGKVANSVKAFKNKAFVATAKRSAPQTSQSHTFVFANQDHAKRRKLVVSDDSSASSIDEGCCFCG